MTAYRFASPYMMNTSAYQAEGAYPCAETNCAAMRTMMNAVLVMMDVTAVASIFICVLLVLITIIRISLISIILMTTIVFGLITMISLIIPHTSVKRSTALR